MTLDTGLICDISLSVSVEMPSQSYSVQYSGSNLSIPMYPPPSYEEVCGGYGPSVRILNINDGCHRERSRSTYPRFTKEYVLYLLYSFGGLCMILILIAVFFYVVYIMMSSKNNNNNGSSK